MADGKPEIDNTEKNASNENDNKYNRHSKTRKNPTARSGSFPKKKPVNVSGRTNFSDKKETRAPGGFNKDGHIKKNWKDSRSHFRGGRNLGLALGTDSKLFRHNDENEIDLTTLLELEKLDANDIIIFLSKNNTAFEKLLTNTLNFNKVVLSLRAISKLCLSRFNEYKTRIITEIIDKDFLQKLKNHIFTLAAQDEREKRQNLYFWRDQKRFWMDLLTLFETIFNILPKTACEKLPKIILASTVSIKNINTDNSDVFNKIIKNMETLHEQMISQIARDMPRKRYEFQDPKENFRNIEIFPSLKEITTREYPFIRQILKDGGYRSVEHYLDIHFRLLREDFVSSLRNGICTYLENQTAVEKTKQFDVRVYENVKFVRPHVAHDRVGILVHYTSQTKENIISENKHFLYGALICFTRDNFKSITYGTVVDSDIQLLKYGNLVIDVQDAIIYDENYTMVETTVFFEPYHQVLKALQNMKEDNFPMKKYIVDVDSKIEHPKYLNEQTKIILNAKMPIRNLLFLRAMREEPVIANGMKITHFKMLTPVRFWPPAEYFKLNPSQYKAFYTALTSEFSIIQGPPGTGKTYTSLKIVEFLLKHKRALQYSGPILVICLTNHALDQFLEGILPFSKEIVRVGGQSKNVSMENLNLRRYRREIERGDDDFYHKGLLEKEKQEIDGCVQNLQCIQNLLEDITSRKGILNLENFKSIDDKIENSWFDMVRPHHIVEWLMEGMDTMNIAATIQEMNTEEPEETIQHELYSKADELDRETRIINDAEHYNSRIHFINNCIITLPEIQRDIFEIRSVLFHLMNLQGEEYQKNIYRIEKYEREFKKLLTQEKYLKWRLNQRGFNINTENIDYNAPYKLSPNERWNLYRHWVHLLHLRAYRDISVLDEKYRAAKRRYLEVQQIVDIHIMKQNSVIGMTTTGAARYQPVLQTLQCPIVIVEEAAEVLESHVVAALTNYCQQLILIGDHRQLRPNPSQYHLAKKYNLDLSLFERMVNNGMHCQQLEEQHRMRPEFSKLITPAIYSNLKDDASVFKYPSVRGVTKNLFFITHNEYEEHMYNSTSHKNIYEAKYLLKLASYLRKQGYRTEDITILTTYTGQQYTLWREIANYPNLKGIRATVVDNFQGEENKIILLSLVRSNENENIGFLKIENRVCVALSRAKQGFFMIGNMDNLEKSSSIWPKIKEVLVKQNSIGPVLTLKCQIHETETNIETHADFKKVPLGGCLFDCAKQLHCGHICKLKCHPYDREHLLYKCKEACEKIICDLGHVCPLKCSDRCEGCIVPVEKTLPCGHTHSIPCSTDPKVYKCPTKIEATLPCGHNATIVCCVKPENAVCPHPCAKIINCGHTCKRQCHVKVDPDHKQYACPEPCEKLKKDCSTKTHKCPKLCSESCEPCMENIKKKRTNCTHRAIVACNFNVDSLECKEKCRKMLPCGHHCPNRCFMPCGNCRVWVDKTIEECGHTVKIRCGIQPEKKLCRNKCSQLLSCGHPCEKNCSEGCCCRQRCIAVIPSPPKYNEEEDIYCSLPFFFNK